MAKTLGETFQVSGAFVLTHGAGHNAGLNHAGDNNNYDEKGNYIQSGIYVPESPNVMSTSRDIQYTTKPLQSFISSPVNQEQGHWYQKTLSIKEAFMNRFGNNTPTATLPTQ